LNTHLIKLSALALFALMAFAANSVLCRLALAENSIDASGFTILRLLSGAVMLAIILLLTQKRSNKPKSTGNWTGTTTLFIYAVTFSYGYILVDTATGALVLFGVLQITLVVHATLTGKHLHKLEWLGVLLAFAGFVYFMLPQLQSPSAIGFILMSLSGIAWAFFTLNGKKSVNPLSDTTYNFLRTLPFLIILALFTFEDFHFTQEGVLLAIASGALTTGIAYAIWYWVMQFISGVQAGVLQVSLPIFAAIGGILFVDEVISLRLFITSVIVIGGIALVMLGNKYKTQAAA